MANENTSPKSSKQARPTPRTTAQETTSPRAKGAFSQPSKTAKKGAFMIMDSVQNTKK